MDRLEMPCWIFATVLIAWASASAGENLLPNGNFEKVDEETDQPEGWVIDQKDKAQFVKEGKNHWIRFKDGGRIKFMIDVKPEWKFVRVAAQMRTTDIKLGKESWNLPRVLLTWTTKDKPVTQGLDLIEDMDWFLREAAFEVPKDAVKLQVEPGLFDCQGTFEVDDISITSIAADDVKKVNDADWRQKHTVMLKNGKFEHGTFELLRDGKPRGWQDNGKFKLVTEGANHYAEISSTTEVWACIETRILLRPEWSRFKVSARMKVKDLKMGKEGWQTSRIAPILVDKEDQKVGDWPPVLELKANADWTEVAQTFSIPAGSYALKISAGLQNASGTFSFDDIKVEPVMGAGIVAADSAAVSSSARREAAQAPTVKLAEVGLEFNADMAQKLLLRRVKPEGEPLSLLSIGPGCPGSSGAPKARVVKYPAHWNPIDTPKELGGNEASPDALLLRLPDLLLEKKPEIVLLWGDAESKRNAKPSERYDWEDVITVCLRMGTLPVIVLPKADVSFAGGGAAALVETKKKDEAKKEDEPVGAVDLESLHRTMMTVGGLRGIPMMEQVPFATTSDRVAKILYLVEKHVLGRAPPDVKSAGGETGTGTGTRTGTKKPDEAE